MGAFTLIVGLLYPLSVTALAQLIFSRQVHGSLILDGAGQPVG